MTTATMQEVSIKVKETGKGEYWRTVKGVKVSKNFAVTEPTENDAWFARFRLTHLPSGMVLTNVDGITVGRRLARQVEKLGDWSRITEPSGVPPELVKAATAVLHP